MEFQFRDVPTLDQVLDRTPLFISAQTSVIDAISAIAQFRYSHCSIVGEATFQSADHCALIMEGTQLLGIFTERDIVRLVARRVDLRDTPITEVMSSPVVTFPHIPDESALTVLACLQRHQIRHLPIVTTEGKIVGIITPSSIREALQPANLLKLRRASDMMETAIIHAPPTASVLKVAQMMASHHVSSVVIVEPRSDFFDQSKPSPDEQTRSPLATLQPVGIVTELDIARLKAAELDLSQTPVQRVMSSPVRAVRAGTSLWNAHQLMQQHRIRRLLVTGEQGELLGILTQSSFLQVFDPLELSVVVATLQHQISEQVIELKQVNQQLSQTRDELEQRVQERTTELVQANAQLRAEIQERIRAEVALRQSEARFRRIADSNIVGIILSSPEGKIFEANQAFLQMVGYDQHDVQMGRLRWDDLTPDEYRVADTEAVSLLAQHGMVLPFEKEYIHKNGHRVAVLVAAAVLEGSTDQVIAVVVNISARKQAEQKITEQAALLNIATDAILVQDLQHRISFWSQGAERTYGWTKAEALGKQPHELFHHTSPLLFDDAVQAVLTNGQWQGEFQQTTKEGRSIIIESRWTLVQDESGQPQSILTVNTDITEKKQLEAQFLRAQRLESIGTLASGIAHDLNNIFTPILAAAQLLTLKLTDLDDRSQSLLLMLEESSKRGANLVKQILAFARGTETKRTVLQIRHVLADVVQVMRQTFPKNIDIRLSLSSTELEMMLADPTQLHQVVMNLCVNARDAMSNGGTLTIAAENRLLDETYTKMHLDARIGRYVVVTVTDTGVGIPPEFMDRIFDPFFTTKEPGKGTGLGLSTVIGIVKNHGGFVNVYSEVNHGTQIQVYLPAVEGQEIPNTDFATTLPLGQGELILIVDDEPTLQQVAKLSLEEHNYRTLVASDGIEAIALYAEHKTAISAVVMDLMMPTMDGLTAIRTLQKMNPHISVIATSGLKANQPLAEMAGIGVRTFLPKPYTARELLEAVQQILGR